MSWVKTIVLFLLMGVFAWLTETNIEDKNYGDAVWYAFFALVFVGYIVVDYALDMYRGMKGIAR